MGHYASELGLSSREQEILDARKAGIQKRVDKILDTKNAAYLRKVEDVLDNMDTLIKTAELLADLGKK